jgi:hypothetical protein
MDGKLKVDPAGTAEAELEKVRARRELVRRLALSALVPAVIAVTVCAPKAAKAC